MSAGATHEGTPDEQALFSSLGRFDDATPELLAGRLLQTRIDRKFVMKRAQIGDFLARLDEGHRLLKAAGAQAAAYETTYFDTADGRMYDDHRRGRVPRFKVRVRHQLERQVTFLEVKRKGEDGRTSKVRLPRTFTDEAIDASAAEFIAANSPFTAAQLEAVLRVTFRRATLLSTFTEERVTLDWGFEFRRGERTERWPRAAIVEIKQPHHLHDTSAVRALRDLGIQEDGISKFCLGVETFSDLDGQAFESVRRHMERVSA